MKRIFVSFLFFLNIISIANAQQKFVKHTVAEGETVFTLAEKYNVTKGAIYALNPNAKESIQLGEVLTIPLIVELDKTPEISYKTHVVAAGDTVYNIAKRYNTTVEAIYELNPETKNGIQLGQVLRVAKMTKEEKVQDEVDTIINSFDFAENISTAQVEPEFKIHKVRRKETLFSISQLYNVSIDDIKKYNRELYSRKIRKREEIKIPIYKNVAAGEGQSTPTFKKYTIQPGETKFSIARQHRITTQELEKLNPEMGETLPIGMEITVPEVTPDVIPEGFELYQVPPKDTMYSLLKRLNISSDSLLQINPHLKEGLKEGMVLTIPKSADSLAFVFEEGQKVNLEEKLYNFRTKKVALMLPFGLNAFDASITEEAEATLKSKRNLRIALDFYSGVLIALDSAKQKGISTEIQIFDTHKNNDEDNLRRIINTNDFSEIDVVIGPLYQKNVEFVAGELKKYDIPVVSPISKKESKLYSNFFQTRPTDVMLQDKIISYAAKDSLSKNMIIIADKKHEEIKNKLKAKFPEAKVIEMRKGGFLYATDVVKVLDKNRPNWVFLESNDVAYVSNVITYLNAKAETHKVTLFTTNKNRAFENDNISNQDLLRLRFHYPSIDREYDGTLMKNFIERYKKENNGNIPNQFAVRGFDIMYDILMRLGTANNLFEASAYGGTTEYVENKFCYSKKLLGGYYNKAMYIVKYDENLKLTVVE
ncbi:LysM peptidoglycan-binding domain-containing protein [Aquimarina rhabdastrellae]